MATEAQLARTRSGQVRREWRVSIGPPRTQITELTFTLGEPVALPIVASLTVAIGGTGASTITVDSTATYATSGTIINRPDSVDAGWYSYTGKTSTTFTGCKHIHGRVDHPVGSKVSAWATIGYYPPLPQSLTQRLDSPIIIPEFKEGQFRTWEATIAGVYFDRRLLKDDAIVLIEQRLSPEGHIEYATEWMVAAVGYVRRWEVTVDSDRNNHWRGVVKSIKTYLDDTRNPASQYGRVEILGGGSVTASDNLANAEDELAEFDGGLGTTDAANANDDNNNTLFITQVAPTSNAIAPGDSDGADPGVQIEEVWRGDAQNPSLWWILLRLAPDSPNYNETGVNLHNFAISNKQTTFRDSNVATWAKELGGGGCTGYVRTRNITMTDSNDRHVLTNNGGAYRARWGDSVPSTDVRFLDGFGDDQEPARNFVLDVNDWLQLRYCRGSETVRSMLVWNTHTGTPYWNGANDENESGTEWNDPSTVTWTTAGTSIRRDAPCENTRSTADWIEETDPNPADRRTDGDQQFWSCAVNEFTVNLASNITNVSPANGGTLTLTNARWFDGSGFIKIDAEEIGYKFILGNTLHGIQRAANGTTAANHTTAALVYQMGDWQSTFADMQRVVLAQYMTPTSPANGQSILVNSATPLPGGGGVIRIDDEHIAYTGTTANTITGITRAYQNTTAGYHVQRTYIWLRVEDLGAHRIPKMGSIEWRRWVRLVLVGNQLRNIVPERFEIYGSVIEEPLYPGDDDWRLDWLDGSALITVEGNGHIHWEKELDRPRRLRHILIYCKKMVGNGRFKLNEVKGWLWQPTQSGTINNEVGAGVAVREALERVLFRHEIQIEAGAFNGTSGDLTTAEASVSEVLDDILAENFCVCRCNRDGTVEVYRDPYHPLGRRVDIDVVFDGEMMRSPMTTDYPSSLGADQIVVELLNMRTGDVYEGRYPPNANTFNIHRIPIRRNGGSQDAANQAAAAYYFKHTQTARTFQFMTSGAAEYLQTDSRILVTDFSDDERPTGQLVNCMVEAITHGVEDVEEVTAREWRAQ